MFMTFLLIGVVLLMVEAAIPGFGIFGVTGLFWFYNLFWGAKVTVQMRVLSAPTFFQ